MAGQLTYEDFNGVVTNIIFYKKDEPTTFAENVEFCGTDKPLIIKWNGGRYSTTAPSSATLNLFIQTLEQRQFLEDVFNGGWIINITKDGQPFWYGQIKPTLGIETYRTYPYKLSLFCTDGIGDLKRKHFLMVDFPEPALIGNYTVIDIIVKLIDLYLYPNGTFTLNECMRISYAGINVADLSETFVDPRVFMKADVDEYIDHESMLESLLGLFNLQLFQWKQQWWLFDLEAQWDKGSITYIPYLVQDQVWVKQTEITEVLAIFDLYSCDKNNIEIGSSGRLDFIEPLLNATINQQFQLNNNILPVFTNRTGGFYHGHDIQGEYGGTTFQDLEFRFDDYWGQSGNLRHWVNYGLVIDQWPDNTKTNTGYAWVKTVASSDGSYVEKSIVLNSNVQFHKFMFAVNATATINGLPDPTEGLEGSSLVFQVEFEEQGGAKTWNLWYNNYDGATGNFFGWTSEGKVILYPGKEINIQSSMPDDSLFTGGKFTVRIYNSVDEHVGAADHGNLLYNMQLGIVATEYETIPINEIDKSIRQRKMITTAVASAFIEPATAAFNGVIFGIAELINQNTQKKRREAAGGQIQGTYRSDEVNWDDSASIDINPNAQQQLSFDYRLGLSLLGITSYHNLQLSSFYDQYDNALDFWYKTGYPSDTGKNLVQWKLEQFLRDNSQYTTKLSGRYKSNMITPLQLIYDYEGRVYRFLNGTYDDKRGEWNCSFMEFKAAIIPGQSTLGDFSSFAFNNDFYTLSPYYDINLIEEPFDLSTWVLNGVTIDSDAIVFDPNPSHMADKIVEDTSTGIHRAQEALYALELGEKYIGAAFIKSGGRDWVCLELAGPAFTLNRIMYFNLLTGTPGVQNPNIIDVQMVDYGNGWWFVSLTGITDLLATGRLRIFPALADGNQSYLGDGVSGVYAWNGQLRKEII